MWSPGRHVRTPHGGPPKRGPLTHATMEVDPHEAAAAERRWGFSARPALAPALASVQLPPAADDDTVDDATDSDGEAEAQDFSGRARAAAATAGAAADRAKPTHVRLVRWFDKDGSTQRGASAAAAFAAAGVAALVLLLAFQPRMACDATGRVEGRRVILTSLVVACAAAAFPLTLWWRSVRGDGGDA